MPPPGTERSLAFLQGLEERAAERVVPWEHGVAVIDTRTPQLWDANLLRADDAHGAKPRRLRSAADRVLGEAGLRHRMIVVPDEAEGGRLAPGFAALGWTVERHLVMVLGPTVPHVPPDGPAVAESRRADVAVARREMLLAEPWGGPAIADQVLAHDRALEEAAGDDRWFVVHWNGDVASCCRLLGADGVGQVEDVVTAVPARRRGFARAVVAAAARASRAAGHEVTFIVVDEADRVPRTLYADLGFQPAARIHRFRAPAPG
jgi:GNAT superfamily N-acetyltransferase